MLIRESRLKNILKVILKEVSLSGEIAMFIDSINSLIGTTEQLEDNDEFYGEVDRLISMLGDQSLVTIRDMGGGEQIARELKLPAGLDIIGTDIATAINAEIEAIGGDAAPSDFSGNFPTAKASLMPFLSKRYETLIDFVPEDSPYQSVDYTANQLLNFLNGALSSLLLNQEAPIPGVTTDFSANFSVVKARKEILKRINKLNGLLLTLLSELISAESLNELISKIAGDRSDSGAISSADVKDVESIVVEEMDNNPKVVSKILLYDEPDIPGVTPGAAMGASDLLKTAFGEKYGAASGAAQMVGRAEEKYKILKFVPTEILDEIRDSVIDSWITTGENIKDASGEPIFNEEEANDLANVNSERLYGINEFVRFYGAKLVDKFLKTKDFTDQEGAKAYIRDVVIDKHFPGFTEENFQKSNNAAHTLLQWIKGATKGDDAKVLANMSKNLPLEAINPGNLRKQIAAGTAPQILLDIMGSASEGGVRFGDILDVYAPYISGKQKINSQGFILDFEDMLANMPDSEYEKLFRDAAQELDEFSAEVEQFESEDIKKLRKSQINKRMKKITKDLA